MHYIKLILSAGYVPWRISGLPNNKLQSNLLVSSSVLFTNLNLVQKSYGHHVLKCRNLKILQCSLHFLKTVHETLKYIRFFRFKLKDYFT